MLACISQPVIKGHDGPGITQSVIDELNSWDIQGGQVEGGSIDGQYFHLSIPAHQKLSIFRTNLFAWDPHHKRGLIDSHFREDPSFS